MITGRFFLQSARSLFPSIFVFLPSLLTVFSNQCVELLFLLAGENAVDFVLQYLADFGKLGARFFFILLHPFRKQVVLSSLAASLSLWLGWRIYGVWVGWLAGLLGATYGIFIYFSAEILGTVLVVLTSLLAIVLLVWADRRRSLGPWFLAGLALGLAALVRPTILVFGVLALLWAKGGRSWRGGWGRSLVLAGGLVLSEIALARVARRRLP